MSLSEATRTGSVKIEGYGRRQGGSGLAQLKSIVSWVPIISRGTAYDYGYSHCVHSASNEPAESRCVAEPLEIGAAQCLSHKKLFLRVLYDDLYVAALLLGGTYLAPLPPSANIRAR